VVQFGLWVRGGTPFDDGCERGPCDRVGTPALLHELSEKCRAAGWYARAAKQQSQEASIGGM
jgi:hypothetical protein